MCVLSDHDHTMLASLMESKLFTFRSASMTVILSIKNQDDKLLTNIAEK